MPYEASSTATMREHGVHARGDKDARPLSPRPEKERPTVTPKADIPPRASGAAAESKLLLTVEEAAKRLRIGRTVMYWLVSSGTVESVTVGSLRRVPAECPSEFVAPLRRLSDPRGERCVLLWMIADRKSGAPSIARD
jgi:excisionase family DNA binding protein